MLRLSACQDWLVPSQDDPRINTLRVQFLFQVLNKSEYGFVVTNRDFNSSLTPQEDWDVGTHSLTLDFTPSMYKVGSNIEQGLQHDGPYSIDAKLTEIQTLNGSWFGESE